MYVNKENCDKIEKCSYFLDFTPDELASMKDKLSEVLIQLNEIEQEKKATVEIFKEKMKPLEKEIKTVLSNIKLKKRWVSEECYVIFNHDTGYAEIYNTDGIQVDRRALKEDERQTTIMSINRKIV